jgi:hypothetical protein
MHGFTLLLMGGKIMCGTLSQIKRTKVARATASPKKAGPATSESLGDLSSAKIFTPAETRMSRGIWPKSTDQHSSKFNLLLAC